jgi:high-affinity Fe2+/Pb2+ permease
MSEELSSETTDPGGAFLWAVVATFFSALIVHRMEPTGVNILIGAGCVVLMVTAWLTLFAKRAATQGFWFTTSLAAFAVCIAAVFASI